jgi:hypothetical protein
MQISRYLKVKGYQSDSVYMRILQDKLSGHRHGEDPERSKRKDANDMKRTLSTPISELLSRNLTG